MPLPFDNTTPVPDDILAAIMGEPVQRETPQDVVDFASGEIPMEGEAQDTFQRSSQPQPQVQSVSSGVSDSASHSGLNTDTLGYLQTKGMRGYQAQDANAYNKATRQGNEMLQPFVQAGNEEKAATVNLGNLEADKAAADAEFKGQYQNRLEQHAIETDAIYQEAAAKTQKYAADYETQLKQLSTMGVNPGRLYQNMTKGEKASTLFGAFISDFLGAKGIKTSAMDYINQAIDRDIDSQVNAINTKGRVVDGFKQMWDMQRAMSDSDVEAKLRMKGIELEAFKMGIAAKLGQFDSDIARAKIPAAIAAIDEKQAKVKADVLKFRADQYNNEAQRNVALRGQNLQASIARDQIAHSERMAAMTKGTELKAKEDELKRQTAVRVAEVRPDGTRVGRVVGFAGTKERTDDLQNRVDGLQNSLDSLERLRNLHKDSDGSWNYFGKKLTEDEVKAEMGSLYEDMISDIALAKTGKAGNEQEYARLREIIKQDDFIRGIFQSGDGGDIAASSNAKWGIRQIEANNKKLVANLTPPSEQDKIDFAGGTSGDVFQPYKTSNETFNKPKPAETPAEKAIKKVESTRFGEGVTQVKKDDDLYKDALEIYETLNKLDNVSGSEPRYFREAPTRSGKPPVEYNLTDLPDWLGGMHDLSERATAINGTEAEYNKAIEYLTGIIADKKNNTFDQADYQYEDRKVAAEYYLNEILTTGYRGESSENAPK